MIEHLSTSVTKYWIAFIEVLPRLGLAVIIVIIGVLAAGWISGLFRKRIADKAHDPLMGRFLGKTIRVGIIVLVCFLGLHAAGLSGIAGGILATAGASAVVIGFAFKDIAENFIAGIILSFNRPFNIDEMIQIDTTYGKVKDMAFRYTRIQTPDGKDVYIPNADVLKKPVTNYTANGFYRMDFTVGIAYESSIEKAVQIMQACIDEMDGVVHDDKHVNYVIEDKFATSTVDLKAMFWITTKDFKRAGLITRGKLMRKVIDKFNEADIYIPCEVHELKNYGPAKEIIIKNTKVEVAGTTNAEKPA